MQKSIANKPVKTSRKIGEKKLSAFEDWLEQIFVPYIKTSKKTVFFIDNARHHRKDAIYDIADEYGFTVIFLPKYSPDLNPGLRKKSCR